MEVSEHGEDLARLREHLRRTLGQPPRLLTPLPRRARLRLAMAHATDSACIWLISHGHPAASGRLWRITGRWTGRPW